MRADLTDRCARFALEAGIPAEVQSTLAECFDALSKPIIVDVVLAERLIAKAGGITDWDMQLAGVFSDKDRANTIADQLNNGKESPWMAGVVRVTLDCPLKLEDT